MKVRVQHPHYYSGGREMPLYDFLKLEVYEEGTMENLQQTLELLLASYVELITIMAEAGVVTPQNIHKLKRFSYPEEVEFIFEEKEDE
jgi:hypothetical protein